MNGKLHNGEAERLVARRTLGNERAHEYDNRPDEGAAVFEAAL